MRRKDREIKGDRNLEILETGVWGTLSLNNPGKAPYAVPMHFLLSEDKTFLYIHGAADGHKNTLIRHDGKATLTIVENVLVSMDKFNTAYDSVILTGDIEPIVLKDEKIQALTGFAKKYTEVSNTDTLNFINSFLPRVAVFKFKINSLSGKSHR